MTNNYSFQHSISVTTKFEYSDLGCNHQIDLLTQSFGGQGRNYKGAGWYLNSPNKLTLAKSPIKFDQTDLQQYISEQNKTR